MVYEIEIEIGSGPGPNEFALRVLRAASGGEPTATLRLDLDRLLAGRDNLERAVMISTISARRSVPVEEAQLRAVGRQLFDALFQGSVHGAYRASMMVAQQHSERLRIVLRLNAPGLAALPWEALWDPEVESYTCLWEPLVRHVPAPYRLEPLDVEAPLRILGLTASPRGLPELDVEAEQKHLSAALAGPIGDGLIELHWVQQATWQSVHDRLLSGQWHVLHFVGHGDYDVDTGQGRIAFVGPDGRKDMVEADRLAALLGEAEPTPRLAVLNSCSSGEEGTRDLFSGTAAALVRSGITAVAAMQFTISDHAALRFARGFYTALARGRDITAALRAGRIEILGTPRSLEWVTPVLYLRGDNARLFDLRSPDIPDTPLKTALQDRYERARASERSNDLVDAIGIYEEILKKDSSYRDSAERRQALERLLERENGLQKNTISRGGSRLNAPANPEIEPGAPTDGTSTPERTRARSTPANVAVAADTEQQTGATSGWEEGIAPREIFRLNLDEERLWRRTKFSPNGGCFAVNTKAGARLVDTGEGQEIGRIPRRGRDLQDFDLAFSPDGRRFATAVSDRVAVLWDVANGEEIARLKHRDTIHNLTFSPDGRKLATSSGSYGGSAIGHAYLWDTSNGQRVASLKHGGTVFCVAFSPDGNRIATASDDKSVGLWEASSHRQLARLKHQGTVFSVEFSSDGTRLATWTSFTDRLWDVTNHREVLRVTVKRGSHDSTLSSDSTRFVRLSEYDAGGLWDMVDGRLIARLAHDDAHEVAFSPDGSRFVTTGGGSSRIWDSRDGHEIRRFEHDANLLATRAPGTWIATHGDDGRLLLWSAVEGQEVGHLQHDGPATLQDISPDERCVAIEEVVDGNSRLRLWQLRSAASLN